MRRLSGVGVGFIDKERQRKADETTQLLFAKMVCRAMHTILTILLYSRFLSLSRGSRSLVLTAWAHSHPHLLFPGGKPFPGLPITLNHGCAPSIGANHLVRRYGSQTREVACPTPASVYTSRDLSLLGSLLHPPADVYPNGVQNISNEGLQASGTRRWVMVDLVRFANHHFIP
jgi:hypothetical protein